MNQSSLRWSVLTTQNKTFSSYKIIYTSTNPHLKQIALTLYDQSTNQIAYRSNAEIQFHDSINGVYVYMFKCLPSSYMNNMLRVEVYEESSNKKFTLQSFQFHVQQEVYFLFINQALNITSILSYILYTCLSDIENDSFWNYYYALINSVMKFPIKQNEYLKVLAHVFTSTKLEDEYVRRKKTYTDDLFMMILCVSGIVLQKEQMWQEKDLILIQSSNMIQMMNKMLIYVQQCNGNSYKKYLQQTQNALMKGITLLLFMDVFMGEIIFINEFLINKSKKYTSIELFNVQSMWQSVISDGNRVKRKLNSNENYDIVFQKLLELFPIEYFIEYVVYIVPSKEKIFELLITLKSKSTNQLGNYINGMSAVCKGKTFMNFNRDNIKKYLKQCDFMLANAPHFLLDFDDSLIYITTLLETLDHNLIDMNYIIGLTKSQIKIYKLNEISVYLQYYIKNLDSTFLNRIHNNIYIRISEFLISMSIPYDKEDFNDLRFVFQNPKLFKYDNYVGEFLKNPKMKTDDYNIVFKHLFIPAFDLFDNNKRMLYLRLFLRATQFVLKNDPNGFPTVIEEFHSFIAKKNFHMFYTQNETEIKNFWTMIYETTDKHLYYTVFPNKISPNESFHDFFISPFRNYVNTLTDVNEDVINQIIKPFCAQTQQHSLLYILSNNRTIDTMINILLDKAETAINVNERFQKSIIESPSNEHFWYLCATAKGEHIKFRKHRYLVELYQHITTLYNGLIEHTLSFKIGFMLYKSSQQATDMLINYFLAVIGGAKENDIRNIRNTFFERFRQIYEPYFIFLATASKFNFYFEPNTKKRISDIGATFDSDEFQAKLIKDITLDPLIEKCSYDFTSIYLWSESVAFMKSTEIDLHSNSNQMIGTLNEDEFRDRMQKNIKNIKTLFDKVINTSISKFPSTFITLYENLKNINKEYNIISRIFTFTNDQHEKAFKTFLQNFIDYQTEMPFVNAMHKLNEKIKMNEDNDENGPRFRKSQTLLFFVKTQTIETTIYNEFLDFQSKDSSTYIEMDAFANAIRRIQTYKSKVFSNTAITADNKDKQIAAVIEFVNVYCDNVNLISFLSSKNTNELHSMIELIDDQSDDMLNIQIILNLINIKTFLTNTRTELHDGTAIAITEQTLLMNIYKEEKLHEIISYIKLCSELLASIEGLYNELANKEASSTLKIKEILQESTVIIENGSICISCKHKRKLTEKDIQELKDRCLLFVSTEQSNTLFISLSITIANLKTILKDMALNGYPLQIKQEIPIMNNDINALSDFLTYIQNQKKSWDKTLEDCFVKYYPLSLYHGSQFWEIEKWFTGDNDNCGESLLMRIGGIKHANVNSLRNIIINTKAKPNERFKLIGEKLLATINNDVQGIYNKSRKIISQEQIPILLNLSVNAFYNDVNGNNDSNNNTKNVNNLLFASVPENEGNVYHYILSLYLSYQHSLPNGAQILFCDASITYHHLITFLLRATLLNNAEVLFTLVGVEQLQFELQVFLLKFFKERTSTLNKNWSICLITCEEFSYITSQLSEWDNVYKVQSMEILEVKTVLALLKDNNFLNSVMFTSDLSGNGKSFTIERYKATANVNANADDNEVYEYYPISIQDELDIHKIVSNLYDINHSTTITTAKKKKLHMIVRGLIKNYKLLDNFLFSYLYLDELIICNDIYYCYNNSTDYLICIEVANDISIPDSKVLQLMPDKVELSFRGDQFEFPEDKSSDQYKHMLYFLNYCVLHATSQIDDYDITPQTTSSDDDASIKWESEFTIDNARSIINDYIIQYHTHRQMTYRQLWIYLNFMGSQLEQLSRSVPLKKKVVGDQFSCIRSILFESFLISCEEFSMNKNIISWDTMQNKYILLINENIPMSTVHEDADLLPELYKQYQNVHNNSIGDYNSKKHNELVNILKKYYYSGVCDTTSKQSKGNNVNNSANEHYVLTPDNFLKMILIIQRVLAKVPIILIGETGCGKTSLIRFLAQEILQEEFHIINIHAGITHDDIQTKITDIINLHTTDNNNNNDDSRKTTWIFLDELNTCNHLGFLSEIICEHKMNGKPLPRNFYFIGASNPYQQRSSLNTTIQTRLGVGLSAPNANTKSDLVYKVNKFPNSINDYIWDYGKLPPSQAEIYIKRILSDLDTGSIDADAFSNMIVQSQIMIMTHEPIYKVSLRDIARFKQIYNWFMKFLKDNQHDDHIEYKCLIMSLFICYYIKFSSPQHREKFLQAISSFLSINYDNTLTFIKNVENLFIKYLDINPIYAKNTALVENLFTLFVSIHNKIPLFICGKPGNSKTLSVQIITSNFRGKDSKHPLLQAMHKLIPVYYQGSEASTSEGIQKAFDKAITIAEKDTSSLPLIIFDEIGLAENSPSNPLKILHSLFDYSINDKLCFVGISNWALDASKMSRVLYLARPEPNLEDLILTGKTLYNSMKNNSVVKKSFNSYREMELIVILSKVYYTFKLSFTNNGNSGNCSSSASSNINEDFYGIRDYYSLIKKVVYDLTTNEDKETPLKRIMKTSLCRNFGGIDGKIEDIIKLFNTIAKEHSLISKVSDLEINDNSYNTIDLIRDNLTESANNTLNYIPRYLLLFTNNNPTAIYLLNHYLNTYISTYKVIIGSKFKRDIENEDYIFKTLSEIILNMEKGTCIVLKGLDYLYGALYDLFNQNFSIIGNRKNCRIALGGTNNPMCYVHDTFKCIVVSDDVNLPPPFLNRFEKQIISYNHIITDKHVELYIELVNWLHNELLLDDALCELCFVGFDKDNFLYGIIIRNLARFEEDSTLKSQSVIDLKQSMFLDTEVKLKLNIRKEVVQLANMNFSLGIAINEDNLKKKETKNVLALYYVYQCHTSFNDFHEKYKAIYKYVAIYTYSNILDNVNATNQANLNVVSLSEIQSEMNLMNRLQLGNAVKPHNTEVNTNKGILIIKIDYKKCNKHLDYLIFKLKDKQFEIENIYSHVYLIIYISSAKEKITINPFSAFYNITIDNINGSKDNYDKTKELLGLSSLQIIQKFFDKNVFNEFITKTIFTLNYVVASTEHKYTVSNHVMKLLALFKNETLCYFTYFHDIITNYVKLRKCPIGDWKTFVIEQRKNYPIYNMYKVIKSFIFFALNDAITKMFVHIESSNSFELFMNNEQLFKKLFSAFINNTNKFNRIKKADEIFYIGLYKFPFSMNNILELLSLQTYTALKMLDNNVYKSPTTANSDNMRNDYQIQINSLLMSFKNSCYVLSDTLQLTQNDVMNYINDIYVCYLCHFIKQRKHVNMFFKFIYAIGMKILANTSIQQDMRFILYHFIFLSKNKEQLKHVLSLFTQFINAKLNIQPLLKDIIDDINKQLQIDNVNCYHSNQRRIFIEKKVFSFIYNRSIKFIFANLSTITTACYKDIMACFENTDSTAYVEGNEHFYDFLHLVYVTMNKFNITNINFNDAKCSNCSEYEYIAAVVKQIVQHIYQDKKHKDIIEVLERVVLMKVISAEIKGQIMLIAFNNEKLLQYSNALCYYYFTKAMNVISDNVSNYNCIIKGDKFVALTNFFNQIREFNAYKKMFFIEHFMLYLVTPKTKNELEKYLSDEFNFMFDCAQSISNSANSGNNISQLLYVLYIAFLKHYYLIYAMTISHLTLVDVNTYNHNQFEHSLLNQLNQYLTRANHYAVVRNCKYYTLKNLALITKLPLMQVIDKDFQVKTCITWVNKAQLENDANILGLIPVIDVFEAEYKECEVCMSNIIKDGGEDVEKKKQFLNYIYASKDNYKKKFSILNYIISNLYTSYTINDFKSSSTYTNINHLFTITFDDQFQSTDLQIEIQSALQSVFTRESEYNYIISLLSNFTIGKNIKLDIQVLPEFTLTPTTQNLGLLLLMNYIYALTICFNGVNSSGGNIFTQLFGDITVSLREMYFPGNQEHPLDCVRQNIINNVKADFASFGKDIGLYECNCGYLYTIGNCTRPEVKIPCVFCDNYIGAKSHHKVVDTSTLLINVDNKKGVTQEGLLNNLESKLKKTKGYFYHGDFIPLRNVDKNNVLFFSIFVHSMFILHSTTFNDVFYNAHYQTEMNNVDKKVLQIKESYKKAKNKTNKTDDEIRTKLQEDIITVDSYLHKKVFNAYKELENNLGTGDTYIILYLLLQQLIELIIESPSTFDFTNYESRNTFEENFVDRSKRIYNSISTSIQTYKTKHNIELNNILLKILTNNASETDIEQYDKQLLSNYIFFTPRSQFQPSWSSICLHAIEEPDKYRYISILNKYNAQIDMMQNLFPILNVSNRLLNMFNATLSRNDGKDIKLSKEFGNGSSEEWQQFTSAWKNISHGAVQYKCKILERLPQYELDLSLAFLLCDDKEPGFGMYLACAYEYFGKTQNEIIEEIYERATTKDEGDNVAYPIQSLTPKEVLRFDKSNINIYEKFFSVFTFTNERKVMECDYDKINTSIKQILTDPMIKLVKYDQLNVIQYTNELLSFNENQHSNFITIIKSAVPQTKIVDQKVLTQIESALNAKGTYDTENLYSNIELLCCQLKYENKLSPSQTLKDYITSSDKRQHYTLLEQWNVCNDIHIENIIDFYEIVEERMFDCVIELISAEYKEPFDNRQNKFDDFKEKFGDDNGTIVPKLIYVIKALKKFVVRALRTDIEKTFVLKHNLYREDFWNENDGVTDDNVDYLIGYFPDDILIAHTFSTLDVLIELYNKKHMTRPMKRIM